MRRLLLCVVVLGCEVETRLEIVGCAVVHTEEGRACVLPIHETGFECPPDMPHRTERQGQLICSEAPLEEAQVDDVLDRLHLPEEGEMTLDGSPDPKPDASLPEDAEVDAQAPEPPDLPVEAAGTAWSCGAGAEASAQHGTCIPAAPRSCQGGAAVGCAALCEADCVVEPSIGPGTRGCRGCQRSPEQGTPNVECSPEAGACDGIEVPGDCHDLIAGFCDGLPFDIEDQPEGALFVVPGAAPGGVGTLQSPFADLGVALAAARPGDLVLLDRGLHVVEHLRVPPGVEVRGPCPVISSLRGDLTLAEGSRLEGLALEGLLQVEEGASVELALLTGPRATLGDGASLTGDRLWQMQLGGSGRALECSLCELTLAEDLRLESATLDRVEVSGRLHASSVEITRATLDGLQSEDTHVEVACIRGDVELRGPVQLSDAQLAGGLVVEADESAVVLRRLVLEGEGTFELGGSNLLDLAWVWARDRRLRLNGHADPADITGGLGRLLLRDMVGEAILANPTAFAHALVERTEVDEFEMRGNELDVHEVSVRGLANLHAGVTRVSDLHVLGALYLRGTEMDVSGLTVLPREAAVARNDGLDAQIITYRWSRAVFGRTRLTNLAIQGELTFERRTDVALELRQSFAEGLSVRDTAFEDIVEGVTLEDVELGALDLDPATQLELRRVRIDGAGEVGLRRTGSLDASGLHISGFETALELAGARARLEHVRLQGLVAMRLEAEEGGETPHLSGEDLHLEGEATGLHVRAGEVELRGLHALSPRPTLAPRIAASSTNTSPPLRAARPSSTPSRRTPAALIHAPSAHRPTCAADPRICRKLSWAPSPAQARRPRPHPSRMASTTSSRPSTLRW